MSVGIWLIWINPKRVEKIIYIYFVHLLINGSWSIFFFGLHLILVSLIIIAIIIFFVVWLIKLYYPINKVSSLLMLPYLMWLSYAFILNFYIFEKNGFWTVVASSKNFLRNENYSRKFLKNCYFYKYSGI